MDLLDARMTLSRHVHSCPFLHSPYLESWYQRDRLIRIKTHLFLHSRSLSSAVLFPAIVSERSDRRYESYKRWAFSSQKPSEFFKALVVSIFQVCSVITVLDLVNMSDFSSSLVFRFLSTVNVLRFNPQSHQCMFQCVVDGSPSSWWHHITVWNIQCSCLLRSPHRLVWFRLLQATLMFLVRARVMIHPRMIALKEWFLHCWARIVGGVATLSAPSSTLSSCRHIVPLATDGPVWENLLINVLVLFMKRIMLKVIMRSWLNKNWKLGFPFNLLKFFKLWWTFRLARGQIGWTL